ncbi:jg24066 [Pararge aegeria aegeria]|uniref:Jg24066 protein n=1 Tax=Pararge aegeria aegeria TaxID=348720 RepID=A0A8S4QLQ9_9NEOP|nr:jg24066 [Pararge aegeria aegeria]
MRGGSLDTRRCGDDMFTTPCELRDDLYDRTCNSLLYDLPTIGIVCAYHKADHTLAAIAWTTATGDPCLILRYFHEVVTSPLPEISPRVREDRRARGAECVQASATLRRNTSVVARRSKRADVCSACVYPSNRITIRPYKIQKLLIPATAAGDLPLKIKALTAAPGRSSKYRFTMFLHIFPMLWLLINIHCLERTDAAIFAPTLARGAAGGAEIRSREVIDQQPAAGQQIQLFGN